MANQILENINKRSSEIAEKGQRAFNAAYQRSLDALGIDEEQVRSGLDKLNERREKLETGIQQAFGDQMKDLQSLEVKVLGRLEEAVAGFKNIAEANFGKLSESLDKFENRIREVEKNLSSQLHKLPIADYDLLNADEIVQRLEALKLDQLKAIRAYESDRKGRVTVLKAIDSRLAG